MAQSMSHPARLNLGCCDNILPGWINTDLVHVPGVDVTADLTKTWPWPDDTFDEIRAYDIIEHFPSHIHTMNELWRVLKPGGVADIRVPTTDGRGAWQDPTHVSFWNRHSFWYYEVDRGENKRFANHYGIKARFKAGYQRTRGTPVIGIVMLHIKLTAVK